MSRVYRVLRGKYARTPFDGEGAYRYGGRWSSPGVRLSYTSEHQSLAMLEYFVHLDKDDPPRDLVLAMAETPDDLSREKMEVSELPANWRDAAAPPELSHFGDEFAEKAEHPLLFVPSVLSPGENNCLINPAHPDYKRIKVLPWEPLRYDPRMFATGRGRRRRRS
ncbi:MAG TPA: RES family NAD+ phosphorylase [Terriglobales bacterium]|nr:RES family NAD+ phosphorylase [Terriglobales bacterium]